MKQRPIKVLVDALNKIGAEILYLENEGFPPIYVKRKINQVKNQLKSTNQIKTSPITKIDNRNEKSKIKITSFKELIDKKVKIIFTVDCGTLSFEAINYSKTKNVDVLVLDHHQSELELPDAHSIVNPNRFDDNSNLKYLCAAGVCFMFLVALNKKLRDLKWFPSSFLDQIINFF